MRKALITMIASLAVVVSMTGCKFLSTGIQPETVRGLQKTIRDMRTRDYEKGRVYFSSTAAINSKTLNGRIERLMEAENNAAVATGDPKPHPDVKKSAADATANAMKNFKGK